ncbi:NrpR regulatory domain-containing protein [Methanobrevibacter sp.]|uniref:NrpR regulatory domain-containing protein n=1 Tax=Methanobrevibacter sp. TaxID=66852 RepID=UPI002E787238|nr:NrpR regulatory domain-containing protein [Methanobrevibacter sp.]MEE1336365.1 NrpR regulatory domain-containing protein [Methanobrevibacter sp.]
MSESEYRMIEILRVLAKQDQPTGSKVIADELKEKGFNLGERAVRYHMQILDEKGYTEKKGYAGRVITDLGREKLEKGLIYDQVDFIYSKFEEMIYLTDFTYMTQKGNVVVNTSTIYNEESINIMKEINKGGLSVSPYVNINEDKITGEIEVTTICGTTIDGILLNEGIPTQPQYGGLLKIENNRPIKFTEIISYKKTSVTPLDAFANSDLTSVLDVITKGTGLIPANFRLIPGIAREKTIGIIKELINIGIGGVIGISEEGQDLLGLPVPDGMVGIAIIGGITPFCAVKEMGEDIDLNIGETLQDFDTLKPITSEMFPPLHPPTNDSAEKISLVLSKSLNLIQQVNFDVEKQKGDIIANVSYVNRNNIDKALSVMEDTYNNSPKYINPYYKLVEHPENDDLVGIATICSLSIDGILINNGIMSNPTYSGLLELTEPPLFIDLISYNGTTLDPHKIFLSKNMTSITGKNGPNKVLASVKEIPYISRDHAVEILEILNNIGFSIYKIGKPRELVYNSKVDNYNFGVITGGGLNSIGAVKESGIPIQVKALEKLMPFEKMDRL